MGAVIASDRIVEPFLEGTNSFTHGFTFAGTRWRARSRWRTSTSFEQRGHPRQRARERARTSARCSSRCATSRSSATSAAPATSTRIELVKDRDTKESFSDEESETLLRGFLSGELFRRGLICRADDRGDPVIQLSPPLIAGPEEFAEIESVLRPVLEEARDRMHVAMKVGVPTEIKTDEYRVALTPAGVRELVEPATRSSSRPARGRARRSPTPTTSRRARGSSPDADAVFAGADMIVKVKEPQPAEVARLGRATSLFTYLHLAPDPELTRGLVESRGDVHRLRDRRGRLRRGCRCWRR